MSHTCFRLCGWVYSLPEPWLPSCSPLITYAGLSLVEPVARHTHTGLVVVTSSTSPDHVDSFTLFSWCNWVYPLKSDHSDHSPPKASTHVTGLKANAPASPARAVMVPICRKYCQREWRHCQEDTVVYIVTDWVSLTEFVFISKLDIWFG